MRLIHQTVLWLIVTALAVYAQEPVVGETGFDKGWRKDSSGNLQGAGDNFGSGWRKDISGNLQGSGKNFGSGWRQDSSGSWDGNPFQVL